MTIGNEKFLYYFYDNSYIGALERAPDVFIGVAGTSASGEVVRLCLRIDRGKMIQEAKFKAYGSPATIACAAWVCEWLIGKDLKDASELTSRDISEALDLPEIKLHCALLIEDALRSIL